ncbi:hypothetical protein OH492_07290 [Vibrio chagasii]|nr:hypothetical protein [Vibrio chagasii]
MLCGWRGLPIPVQEAWRRQARSIVVIRSEPVTDEEGRPLQFKPAAATENSST